MQLFAGGLKASRLSDDYTRGIFYAREKLDEILLAEELTSGVINGEFEDGFQWRAEALPLEIPGSEGLRLPFQAFDITVQVGWQEGKQEKHFSVSAVKLVEPAEDTI